MKKLKMFDWINNRTRSTKAFNGSRKIKKPTLSELDGKIQGLLIELAYLNAQNTRSFSEEKRMADIRKEINLLANTDVGNRYLKFDYVS